MTNHPISPEAEISKHGVFLEVMQLGIMLTGRSGIGKSEIALALINRKHCLIADDSVLLHRDPENKLIGRSADILQDMLEVRGLGILNIRAMFGDAAIKTEFPLSLIVNLVAASDSDLQQMDRASGMHSSHDILGIAVPTVTIPVASGRNFSILVEAAVRNQILIMQGFDGCADFHKRHLEYITRERKL